MAFNIDNIDRIEFFIQKENESRFQISVHNSIANVLKDMVNDTLDSIGETPEEYCPSEKYNSKDRLKTSLTGPYSPNLSSLYNDVSIPMNSAELLNSTEEIVYYFCRLTDIRGEKLLAIKKATHFKSLLTSRNMFINLIDDSLRKFTGTVFKLDNLFDIIIVNTVVYINTYSAFESLAELADTVKLASIDNIAKIEEIIPMISFSDSAKSYIKTHIMAARLVASIKANDSLSNLNLAFVQDACQKQGIIINVEDSQISFDDKNTMDFLKLIDRRLYTINLTGEDENFEAKSRTGRY